MTSPAPNEWCGAFGVGSADGLVCLGVERSSNIPLARDLVTSSVMGAFRGCLPDQGVALEDGSSATLRSVVAVGHHVS